jgi:chromate transporter
MMGDDGKHAENARGEQPAATQAEEAQPAPAGPERTRLAEVFAVFLRLGFTAFGGPAAHIAMMRQELVQRRKWLADARFLDLLGEINLIPGPNSTQLALYLGYLRAGWAGLVIAGVCFIGPAMLIVLALAWAYVAFGSAPQAGWLLYGIKPVVIAIIVQAVVGLARTLLGTAKPLTPALFLLLAILVLYLLGVAPLALLFGGALVYGLAQGLMRALRDRGKHPTPTTLGPLAALPRLGAGFAAALRALPGRLAALPASDTLLMVAPAAPISLLTLFLTFLKIGAVLYGSGYVLLAFLRADFVQQLGWLSDRQVLDAVAIGQFTPGPVFTTATFVGYLVLGVPGALLATLAIFLPSFAYVPIVHRVAGWLRRSRWTAPILAGANVAALALMGGVTIQLGQAALIDLVTLALAVVALLILLRFKLNSAWLIAAGALVGLLAHWL